MRTRIRVRGISVVARKRRKLMSPPAAKSAGKLSSDSVPKANNPYSIEVLNRAIDVLSVFSHSQPSLSLAEIVQAVKIPKSTVFRLLSSLAERRLCDVDPQTKKYGLGFELLRLADIRRRQSKVHDVAIPAMREIRNVVNETVILSVRS